MVVGGKFRGGFVVVFGKFGDWICVCAGKVVLLQVDLAGMIVELWREGMGEMRELRDKLRYKNG